MISAKRTCNWCSLLKLTEGLVGGGGEENESLYDVYRVQGGLKISLK